MRKIKYLIVGAGLTADAACKGIRELDSAGTIVVVGEEPDPPYARPPLSKALWKGEPEATIWCGTAELGVGLELGRRVVGVDLDLREAHDDRGESYAYERLLLATGGRPRRLSFGGDEVIYFRTLEDYRHLRALVDGGRRVVVIGGGFIGSEIAAALALNGSSVTMVVPEAGIGARIFPAELSTALVDYYREHRVEVLLGVSVSAIVQGRVELTDGRTREADAVVAGIGIEPNVELAADAGLPIGNGIVVDEFGRVGGREDVFAAGDVAQFPVAALGTDFRVEHEDHAKTHGHLVGTNMAGAAERYDYLPFFYSDLFDLGYEAVGECDSRHDVFADWSDIGAEGTFYYLDQDRRPRGVLLWNLFGRIETARALIRAGTPMAADAVGL